MGQMDKQMAPLMKPALLLKQSCRRLQIFCRGQACAVYHQKWLSTAAFRCPQDEPYIGKVVIHYGTFYLSKHPALSWAPTFVSHERVVMQMVYGPVYVEIRTRRPRTRCLRRLLSPQSRL